MLITILSNYQYCPLPLINQCHLKPYQNVNISGWLDVQFWQPGIYWFNILIKKQICSEWCSILALTCLKTVMSLKCVWRGEAPLFTLMYYVSVFNPIHFVTTHRNWHFIISIAMLIGNAEQMCAWSFRGAVNHLSMQHEWKSSLIGTEHYW